jgi:HlyD family secretion protein
MKKRVVITLAALAVIGAGVAWYYRTNEEPSGPAITTSFVTRGEIVERVDATGTLEAVVTVQVGTQVSGTIKTLRADFNSEVRRGQVIAELEPSLFETQVEQARATLLRLQADAERAVVQREDAERKLRRARELSSQQLISTTDLEAAEVTARQAAASLKSAEAQIVQARASLNQSEVNLRHTIITAPIDGIVISRKVDVGQTVAASMQAPTLFVIARDLTQMRVNAQIAESDVGRIRAGQPVTFRVDAYPGEAFGGTVSQVRLEPVVQSNVVSYVTVIDVLNQDQKLKPGMTANVTIEIERAEDVLRVPNAALRVRPSAAVFAALGQSPPESLAGAAGAAVSRGRAGPGQVWVLTDAGLEGVSVHVGISDGINTAVVSDALQEGTQVVTGIVEQSSTATTTSGTSPLLPFGGRPPGAGRGGTATGSSSGDRR